MDEFQSEKEQIEEIKKWWKENGAFVVTGLVLGVLVLGGWKYWQAYKTSKAESASAAYEELLQAVTTNDRAGAGEIATRIAADYASTPYATHANLAMAHLHVRNNEPEQAASALRAVVDQSGDDNIVRIARVRLARVLIQQDKSDEALGVLDAVEPGEFAALFHDARGDAYAELGQSADARREYQSALDKFEPGLFDREFVEMKLNDLASADPDA